MNAVVTVVFLLLGQFPSVSETAVGEPAVRCHEGTGFHFIFMLTVEIRSLLLATTLVWSSEQGPHYRE